MHPKSLDQLPVVAAPELDGPRRLLWDAANLIEKRGHAKHALEDASGRLCAIGALDCAATGSPLTCDFSDTGHLAWQRLTKRIGCQQVSIWNNAPERTAAEVIQALRDAALS